MTRWIKIVAAFVAGVVLVGVGRLAWMESARTEGPILRSYEVPQEIAEEVRDALSVALAAMGKDSERIGTAIVAPGGQIIVTASPQVQLGVHKIIQDITSRPLPPTPTMAFDLWILTGSPRSGAARDGAMPAELVPVVESLRKSRGDLGFGLLEHLSTSSRPGRDKSAVDGSTAQFQVSSSLQNGTDGKPRVVARIEVTAHERFVEHQPPMRPFALKSQVTLVPGELLVVGQSLARTPGEDSTGQEIYYVLRATL